MKIIDCFIFYNEIDLLNYRLNILNDVVDYFVIVESTHTFTGLEKELYFSKNKKLFEKFQHKIINVIVDDFPYKSPDIDFSRKDQWQNEFFQRNSITKGLGELSIDNNDVIIIADLDEIPDPEILSKIKNNEIKVTVNSLGLDFYYYNLNTKIAFKKNIFNIKREYIWRATKILLFENLENLLKRETIHDIRSNRKYPVIKGGWHLSYFGDEHEIQDKIRHFSHQELNKESFTNLSHIKNVIKNQKDLFNRKSTLLQSIKIEDNDYLPPQYEKYLKKFIID